MSAGAIHVHVAQRHVIEDARTAGAISEGRIAGAVAARSILAGRQAVIDRIGIALAVSGFLVHQGLDASHDRRGERRAPRSQPVIRCAGTGAPICRVSIAERIIVSPNSVGGKERHIGNIAHTVAGISDQRLPQRLWPTGACSTRYTRWGWRSLCAAAWSTTA